LAGLSLDKKFSSSMKRTIGPDGQKADSIKSGITEGSEMLAKGVFRGVTGVFQKPIEGAMKGGAMGFAKGVGKGLIGAVTQPLSGGLAAVGRTAEGIAVGLDSVKTTLGVNALAPQVRVRHPRAEHADGVLRSFESNSARAHYILRTAERGSLAGGSHQVFTRKGYYSRDKYISSLDANSKTTLIVLTDQRVVMLKRVSPTEEKYVALWHCVWSELLHVEVQPPSNVVLHLKEYSKKKRVFEKKRISRVIETTPATQQSRVLMLMISEEIKRHSSSRSKIEEEDGAESGGADELPTMLPCANWKCVAQSGSTCFWAPVPPLDKYAPLGHVVAGSAPPIDPVNVILRRGGPDISASPPVSFELIYRDASNFTVWMPVPPPGFRALGAIVVSSAEAPSLDQVVCVRADYLTASSFDDDPSWTADVRSNESMRRSDRVHFENVSMWSVDNVGRTFIAARSRDCPSDRYALDIVDIFADDE
jgi:vacuolar protein sorting-associated protein 13A/C